MMWVPLVVTLIACLFGTIVIFRIVSAIENVHIAHATGIDPRLDTAEAARAAAQVRKDRSS